MKSRRIWTSIDEIKAANAASGRYWFTPDTMRFFDSKIVTKVIWGRYFISSERMGPEYARTFTVREVFDSGEVSTLGSLRDFTTLTDARAALRAHLDKVKVQP